MTSKAPEAYRTISEVADELNVQPHVLRFWEGKFSQIKPLKRRGGRRYYSGKDIEILRRIQSLLYSEGYTIKGAQKLLKQRGGDMPPATTMSVAQPHPVAQQAVPQQTVSPAMTEQAIAERNGQFQMPGLDTSPRMSEKGIGALVRQELELIAKELATLQADLLKAAA